MTGACWVGDWRGVEHCSPIMALTLPLLPIGIRCLGGSGQSYNRLLAPYPVVESSLAWTGTADQTLGPADCRFQVDSGPAPADSLVGRDVASAGLVADGGLEEFGFSDKEFFHLPSAEWSSSVFGHLSSSRAD